MKSSRLQVFVVLAGLLSVLPLVGCSVNPATGKRILTLQSWDWERQAGAQAAPGMIDEFGGAVPDAEASGYVDEVGRRLLTGIEEGVPDLEWEFTLLDSDVINAFALPGGKVFFSRGLADKLGSEAEMAGVLGHEIGHVTARHGNQRISTQLLLTGGVALASIAVGVADEDSTLRKYGTVAVPAVSVGGGLVLLKYGRDEELEADALGIRYMARAGYDPVGQRRVMETLRAASGPRSQPEWLSTHPESETRIKRIDEMLAGEYAFTQGSDEYVTREDEYRRRMLIPLSRLPEAGHGSQAWLENTSLWCAHCAAKVASAD